MDEVETGGERDEVETEGQRDEVETGRERDEVGTGRERDKISEVVSASEFEQINERLITCSASLKILGQNRRIRSIKVSRSNTTISYS